MMLDHIGLNVEALADGHTTLDNGVLSAAQVTAHHNATLGNMQGFGPRIKAIPAARVRFGT